MRNKKCNRIRKLFSLSVLACFLQLTDSKAFTRPDDTLRVVTYNIHHGNPPERPGVIDMEAIADAISRLKPDLVALQEVDVHTARSGGMDQAKILADRLGMQSFFAKAIDHDGGDYGVAILSALPFTNETVTPLPNGEKGEPRVLATVAVRLPSGGSIRFGATHLDAQRSGRNQLAQVRELINIAQKDSLKMIVGGDFNADPSSPAMKQFKAVFGISCKACSPTFPQINPSQTIDYIGFYPNKAMKVLSHEVVEETYASDHRPVMSVLKLSNK